MWIVILICFLVGRFLATYTQRCRNYLCLTGKTILITGGSKGLGFELALALAARNCRIIIGCRSNQNIVQKKLVERTKNNNIVVKYLDTASLESVRKFAKEIHESEEKIDVLINNAGIPYSDKEKTDDGLGVEMQTNYFGHFLLTHLLIDLLKKGELKRVVFVGSIMSLFHNLTLNTLNGTKNSSFLLSKYSNSKYCMLIASNIFAKKLAKFNIASNCVHPGAIWTDIAENIYANEGLFKEIIKRIYKIVFVLLFIGFGKTLEEGIAPIIHAAICESTKEHYVGSGRFLWDFGTLPSRGTTDSDFCQKVWEISEELVKLENHEKLK